MKSIINLIVKSMLKSIFSLAKKFLFKLFIIKQNDNLIVRNIPKYHRTFSTNKKMPGKLTIMSGKLTKK